MADTARARKLADRIHEIVAETLERRVKDPRLGFVTITDTRVTGDLQHATVFYTVLGDAEEQTASTAALNSAKGVVRSEVGRRTGLRLTPTLEFIADAVPENAAHIDELLQAAAARDADVAAQAAGAQYAGDPDPYRHDEDEDAQMAEADEDVEVGDRR
jgi:ribosome-binding factor A